MAQFSEISPKHAFKLMQEQGATLVDIRNALHFSHSHPKGAFHLSNESYGQFEVAHDDDHPILVLCYHGVSSRGAAMYLIEQGYTQVYSITGGFEAWEREGLPIEVTG
ncbi:thiosulfate sulfurtransferase GlpE [Pasteurella sp. PK-2025]|uniref:thiosulfate sulfurtransferase GlpE n=1 Tax=Pasteurella sp. PK-2025 TaxID=3413133 RepID=UPI003C73A9AE